MSSRHADEEEDTRDTPTAAPKEASVAWWRGDDAHRLAVPALCWPFPPGSQNQTEKAVKLKPYSPPKRRSLNQF